MDWDHVYRSPEDVAERRQELLTALTRKALDERLQLFGLLQSIVGEDIVGCPLCIKHMHEARPDFQLLFPDRRISLEMSRIASQDDELAFRLQEKKVHAVLRRGGCLPPERRPQNITRVVAQYFIFPQAIYLPSEREVEDAWWKRFQAVVERKLMKLSEKDYQHGEEDWLVLWERLGTNEMQMQKRISRPRPSVGTFWKRARTFKRIFIQAEDF